MLAARETRSAGSLAIVCVALGSVATAFIHVPLASRQVPGTSSAHRLQRGRVIGDDCEHCGRQSTSFSAPVVAAFLVAAGAAFVQKSRSVGSRNRSAIHRRAAGEVTIEGGFGTWLRETQEFWGALEILTGPSVDEDEDPAAKAVVAQLNKVEEIRSETDAVVSKKSYLKGKADMALGAALNEVPLRIIDYYKMKVGRVLNKPVVKKGFTASFTYFNVIFIVVFFRTVVPRIIAVQNLDDLFLVANELGVPSKANLQAGLASIQGYDILTRLAYFQAAFIVEKLTLISEILPVQIGLKTVSPLLFGGLLQGALASAVCETIGASLNFAIGRAFLTQSLKDFSLFMEKPLGEQKWFGTLQTAAETEGFKLTLLLRIAHVLPIPFDSYWYILGALPVGFQYFVAGHFVGCLKTCFLDASLGELLLTSVSVEEATKNQFAAAEAAGFAIIALGISALATQLAKDFLGLDEEDVDKDYGSMTVEKLEELLKERDLAITGTEVDFVKRLEDADKEDAAVKEGADTVAEEGNASSSASSAAAGAQESKRKKEESSAAQKEQQDYEARFKPSTSNEAVGSGSKSNEAVSSGKKKTADPPKSRKGISCLC